MKTDRKEELNKLIINSLVAKVSMKMRHTKELAELDLKMHNRPLPAPREGENAPVIDTTTIRMVATLLGMPITQEFENIAMELTEIRHKKHMLEWHDALYALAEKYSIPKEYVNV